MVTRFVRRTLIGSFRSQWLKSMARTKSLDGIISMSEIVGHRACGEAMAIAAQSWKGSDHLSIYMLAELASMSAQAEALCSQRPKSSGRATTECVSRFARKE